jgi:hypothetical protein
VNIQAFVFSNPRPSRYPCTDQSLSLINNLQPFKAKEMNSPQEYAQPENTPTLQTLPSAEYAEFTQSA